MAKWIGVGPFELVAIPDHAVGFRAAASTPSGVAASGMPVRQLQYGAWPRGRKSVRRNRRTGGRSDSGQYRLDQGPSLSRLSALA